MNARHEIKISINYLDYTLLRSRLSPILKHDHNVDQTGEYKVRSLYFDTPTDKALREKIDGVNCREKFRLRRYGNDLDFIRLEKKSKRNGLCFKESVQINKEEVQSILDGQLDWMKLKEEPLFVELYSKMRYQQLQPKVIVEYMREPFTYVHGNVRITLDRNIRTGLRSTDFLNNLAPTIPAGEEMALLEVKYDAFLPQLVRDLLQLDGRGLSAFSKYAVCRMYG